MTNDADDRRRVAYLLEVLADNSRIMREVLEHLAAIDQRLARIEGRILPPNTN